MSYANLSDDMLARLEHDGVSRDARLLYVEGIVHCATALTDGEIRVRLPRLSDAEDVEALADELVAAGYWQRTDYGYGIGDYLKHNRTRDSIIASRDSNRQRQEDYRERGRRHRAGDHSLCTSRCPDKDVTRYVTRDVTAPLPHLTSPNLREVREVRGGDSADGALERAPASPPETEIPSQAHVIADLDYTDYCAWCELPRRNRHHQKAPAPVEEASRRLHLLGASRYAVTQAWDECWDTEATFDGWRLKVEHSSTGKPADAVMTFAEIVIPGVDTAGIADDDWPAIHAALDALVTERIPGARPPSEYEFGDEGDLLAVSVYRDGDMTSLLPDVVALVPEIVAVIAARTEAVA
jgi:hypothetical protein